MNIEIIIIACIVAIACSLPGTFLILRKVSMMSDAISHSILLGIVLAYFIVKDIASPMLIIGATIMGVITVLITEMIIGTRKVKKDASIGLVFPFLFSIAVILITKYASDVHLDADAVLLGELAFAPFNRFIINGLDLGPKSAYVMGAILLLNLVFILVFYKELKISTFDKGLSKALRFSPSILHYSLMTLVSVTAVGAFDSVGSILVVALMIAPPATAYLLTHKLWKMLFYSAIIGILSAISGYFLAKIFDANIAGSMAMMTGVFFLLALLFAPKKGLIAQALEHQNKKYIFSGHMLLIHLSTHENTNEEKKENNKSHAKEQLRWNEKYAKKVIDLAKRKNWINEKEERLYIMEEGRSILEKVMKNLNFP